MSIVMDEKEMRVLAGQLAKNIKTEKDLSDFSRQLKKMTVEAALGAEMEEHLGYAKHDPEGHHTGNSRNGDGHHVEWNTQPAHEAQHRSCRQKIRDDSNKCER